NLSITTPTIIGQDGGNAMVATSGGTISVSNAGSLAIQSVTAGQPTAINFNGGPLSISASGTSSSLTVGDSVTVSNNSSLSITTQQLNLNDGSVINSFATSTINITSPTGFDLTIQAPSGGSATIQTGGGVLSYSAGGQPISGGINITPASGQSLFILKSESDPATLDLNGGAVVTTTTNASTTVNSGVTLASYSLIVMNVNNGTLFNHGLITSSAPGNSAQFNSSTALVYKFASTVTIESLTGSLTLDGDGSGQFSATGSGGFPQFFNICMCSYNIGPNITVLAYGSNSINIDASYTFNTGAKGVTVIGKVPTDVSGAPNLGGSINFRPQVDVTQIGGSLPGLPQSRQVGAITFSAPTISFGAGSSIISNNNSTTDIRITSNQFDTTNIPLTLILPDSANVSLVAG